jgi:hypothetical protein
MSRPIRYELWMYERGLRQGWDIPEAARAEILALLSRVLADATMGCRDRMAAARALLHATRAELDAIGAEHSLPYAGLVARLRTLAEKDEPDVGGRMTVSLAGRSPRCRDARRKRRAMRGRSATVPAARDEAFDPPSPR